MGFCFLVEGCKEKRKRKIICDTLNHVYEDENFDINIQALSATFYENKLSDVMESSLNNNISSLFKCEEYYGNTYSHTQLYNQPIMVGLFKQEFSVHYLHIQIYYQHIIKLGVFSRIIDLSIALKPNIVLIFSNEIKIEILIK